MFTIAMSPLAAAALSLALFTLFACLLVAVGSVRYVPNQRIGIVEKRWSRCGSVQRRLIALQGEAGFQPDVLRGGLHLLTALQYRVHLAPLVTIAQGEIGYVFARDGAPLPAAQTLACNQHATDFEDTRGFLQAGGQRGPQRLVLREGTYAINLAQFVVITRDRLYYLPMSREDAALFLVMANEIAARDGFHPVVITGADDALGIVTIHDGLAQPAGEIIAPIVGADPERSHNNFQDVEKFLAAGGQRGRQLQVLIEGTYWLNRLFATVELIPKTIVEVGSVGVVVSYTGDAGEDLSGREYKHGELVQHGQRGVWSAPLLPGKYAFNTYAGKVIMVPTTNFILKWIRSEHGNHRFDENLSEVSLITRDAFEPSLPLSVVVHIDYRKAPLVVQRFGDVKRLVEQTLDPMVSAYFKNIAQNRTLIQLLQDRAMIQKLSAEEMQEKFSHYNLELEEVLIGTPTSSSGDRRIEDLLVQLRSRQIAEEQVETYARQEKAAVKERELREAEARARQQPQITESELAITVQSNQGKADFQRAVQQAAQMRTVAEAEAAKVKIIAESEAARLRMLAEADALKTRVLGQSEADRITALAAAEAERASRVGLAEALAIEEKVRAYGGPQYPLAQQVLSRFADAIQAGGVDVVPKVVLGSGSSGTPGGVLETLASLLLSERFGFPASTAVNGHPQRPEAKKVQDELRAQIASAGKR